MGLAATSFLSALWLIFCALVDEVQIFVFLCGNFFLVKSSMGFHRNWKRSGIKSNGDEGEADLTNYSRTPVLS